MSSSAHTPFNTGSAMSPIPTATDSKPVSDTTGNTVSAALASATTVPFLERPLMNDGSRIQLENDQTCPSGILKAVSSPANTLSPQRNLETPPSSALAPSSHLKLSFPARDPSSTSSPTSATKKLSPGTWKTPISPSSITVFSGNSSDGSGKIDFNPMCRKLEKDDAVLQAFILFLQFGPGAVELELMSAFMISLWPMLLLPKYHKQKNAILDRLVSMDFWTKNGKELIHHNGLTLSKSLLSEDLAEGKPRMSRYISVKPAFTVNGYIGDAYDDIANQIREYADWYELMRESLPLLFDLTSEVKRGYKSDSLVFYFSDLRKAYTAFNQAKTFETLYPGLFKLTYHSPEWYNNVARHNPLYKHTGQEGEVIITIATLTTAGRIEQSTLMKMHTAVDNLVKSYGEVGHVACRGMNASVGVFEYTVEFFDIEDGMRFVREMKGLDVDDRVQILIEYGKRGEVQHVIFFQAKYNKVHPLIELAGLGKPLELPLIPKPYPTGTAAAFAPRPGDCRCTVMVRNLPNALTPWELKMLLNAMAYGHYNFVYLRIDFDTGNNVGYGFVNFDTPYMALEFAYKFQGTTWRVGNSTKVAAVSYATTQGKENQIQRFRNSGLREQPAPYRPKLFLSLHEQADLGVGALRLGDEMEFPPPDNEAKLRRSVESGRMTGLYNARTRRSVEPPQGLYDNGNPQNFRFA